MAGGDIQKDQLVGALSVIHSRGGDRIPNVSDRVKSDGLDAATALQEERRNETSLQHPCAKSSSSRSS